jgi:hypothetical protein
MAENLSKTGNDMIVYTKNSREELPPAAENCRMQPLGSSAINLNSETAF